MAHTVTRIAMNVVGNKREEFLDVTLSGASSTLNGVRSRLSYIDSVSVMAYSAPTTDDPNIDIYLNTKSASETEDYKGWFFFQNGTDTNTYRLMLVGR